MAALENELGEEGIDKRSKVISLFSITLVLFYTCGFWCLRAFARGRLFSLVFECNCVPWISCAPCCFVVLGRALIPCCFSPHSFVRVPLLFQINLQPATHSRASSPFNSISFCAFLLVLSEKKEPAFLTSSCACLLARMTSSSSDSLLVLAWIVWVCSCLA